MESPQRACQTENASLTHVWGFTEKSKYRQISISYCAWRADPFSCTRPHFRCSLMFNIPPPSSRVIPLFVAALATGTAHAETWAITDAAHPLTSVPADVRVIKLDDQQRIEEQLSRKLPPNPHQAALAARQLMGTPAGAALMQQLAAAQQGNADAWSVGVSKVPAVVVDRRFVVYGQPDVAAAIQAINQARGR